MPSLYQDRITNIVTIVMPVGISGSRNRRIWVTEHKRALTLLGKSMGKISPCIKCDMRHAQYRKGQDVKLFINANDIALSSERLNNITIQNQLKGNVMELIEQGPRLFCRVNVGFDLIVEITREARFRLNINKGTDVWCLFKAVAIDVSGSV